VAVIKEGSGVKFQRGAVSAGQSFMQPASSIAPAQGAAIKALEKKPDLSGRSHLFTVMICRSPGFFNANA
jgi:hypothetical protein